jgi:antitoxin component of RelBE/YafQ-DinJ toxin-antitoxin module
MWFPAEVAAKNGYIEVSNRINQAVKEMSAETASEMGVDYTDIRDTVRPQVRSLLP